MSTSKTLRVHKVAELPAELEADAIYYVKPSEAEDTIAYITDAAGTSYPLRGVAQTRAFDTNGAITGALKLFIGSTTSDATGQWSVDCSAAGFTAPPLHVDATALGTSTDLASDSPFATVYGDTLTATNISGRTIEGSPVVLGGVGITAAPNTPVTVVAWG